MFDVERILAIPDQSIDYLQMGISGGERAALAARGFVRKDGIKAKDYMIRTIQKAEKNKAKAEKAIIKGDRKLSMKDDLGKAVKDAEDAYTANPTPDNYRKLDEKTKAYEMGYMLFGASERWTNAEKNAALIAEKQSKSNRGLEVTYNKKGDLSSAATAAKAKKAISGQAKGGKVVKGVKPSDRAFKEIRRLKGGLLYQNGKVVEYGDGKKFSQADRIKASDLYLKELNDELNNLRGDRKKDIKLDTNPITGERNKRPKSKFAGREKELLARRKAFEAYIKPDKDFIKELQKYSK